MRRKISHVSGKHLTYSAVLEKMCEDLDRAANIVTDAGLHVKLWYDETFEVWRYYVDVYEIVE